MLVHYSKTVDVPILIGPPRPEDIFHIHPCSQYYRLLEVNRSSFHHFFPGAFWGFLGILTSVVSAENLNLANKFPPGPYCLDS